jgi:hypothetical protein
MLVLVRIRTSIWLRSEENSLKRTPCNVTFILDEAANNCLKRSSRLNTFAGIVSTCVSVLSGTIQPNISAS